MATRSSPGLEALEPWKRQALEAYSWAMGVQLMRPENQVKAGWENGDPVKLMNEVFYHGAKLLKAVEALESYREAGMREGQHGERELKRALLEFAADVGNCAMIIAEVTDALELYQDEAVGDDGESAIDWQVTSSGRYP